MILFLHFMIGLVSSFMGMLIPSMLNMTAVKISLKSGKSNAIKFAFGASVVVFVQAYAATSFTQYLRANPIFVEHLQKVALGIFALLTVYFFLQYKKDKKPNATKKDSRYQNSFSIGLLLSGLNMFAIPFYCGVTTALDVVGWFNFSRVYILLFVLGSTLGTFLLLFMYLNYAELIERKAKGLSKNMNLILGVLTGVLTIVTIIKLG